MEGTVGGAGSVVRQLDAHVHVLAAGYGADVTHTALEDPALRGYHLHQMVQFEIPRYLYRQRKKGERWRRTHVPP